MEKERGVGRCAVVRDGGGQVSVGDWMGDRVVGSRPGGDVAKIVGKRGGSF